MEVRRSGRNPILMPTDNWWENRLVSNPGVIELDGKIYLVYTARGEDDIARFGFAVLSDIDVVEERFPYPIFSPIEWFEAYGVEDPRLIFLEGRIFMLYAGKDRDMARICETSIAKEDFLKRKWAWSRQRLLLPIMVGIHNRNAAYFPRRINGRYALLSRPMTMAENIWLSFSYDRIHWYDHREIIKARPGYWDDAKVGIAGPPIEIDKGWLLIYHGVEAKTWTYRLGYVILDKHDPGRVLFRSREPLLEPEEEFEREGVAPNVVFSCGSVLRDRELIIYYGAADRCICVARVNLVDLLKEAGLI